MSETNGDGRRANTVAIVAIIVAGIVVLACIVASTAITIAFFTNAPW